MATVTIKSASPFIEGKDWVSIVEWTGDSSYLEGGELMSLKEAGFGVEAIFRYANTCWVKSVTEQAVYNPQEAIYDGTKVHLYDSATGKEVASTKDVSKVTALFEIHCTSN